MSAARISAPAILASALLAVLPACQGQATADGQAAPSRQAGATVRELPDIDAHFSGDVARLARAAEGDGSAIPALVAAGADPDAVSPGGLPLLAWPVLKDSPAGAAALLDAGADPNLAVPGAGTMMVWAAREGSPDVLRVFLERGGDPDARDANGVPLVKLAALSGRWPNVRLLVEHGADVDAHPPGAPGDTVLGYYSAGQFDKAHWLLEHGADPGHRLENAPIAAREGAQPIVENVFWWPVQAGRFPELARWQQRCQALLAARGLAAPAEPEHLRRLRDAAGAGQRQPARALDEEIEAAEAELGRRTDEP